MSWLIAGIYTRIAIAGECGSEGDTRNEAVIHVECMVDLYVTVATNTPVIGGLSLHASDWTVLRGPQRFIEVILSSLKEHPTVRRRSHLSIPAAKIPLGLQGDYQCGDSDAPMSTLVTSRPVAQETRVSMEL